MKNRINIKASRAEDVLGYVPHQLTFHPRESLVLLSMRGSSLGATLRLDLPEAGDDARLAAFAETAVSYLGADTEADGSLVVVYTDATGGAGTEAFAYWPLAVFLEDLLGVAGTPVRGAWAVGPDSFRCVQCRTSPCCPPQGHPAARIKESHVNLEMMLLGSSVSATAGEAAVLARSGALPDAAPAIRARARDLAAGFAGEWEAGGVFMRVLGSWDEAISSGTAEPLVLSVLLASLESDHVRDAVLVLACLDPAAAYYGAVAHGRVDPLRPVPPELMGVLPFDGYLPGSSGPEPGADLFTDILLGSYKPPVERERMTRTSELLGLLHRLAEGAAKPAAGTMLAWLEWAQGRSSLAHAHLQTVLAESPDYRLAGLLESFFGLGTLPAWLRRPPAAAGESPSAAA
ncbi:DUF4192 domain-containing protein [Arthrobacter mangrovi]|uniref:DUF4192 domain-containing protein n=1 Tax=Arthrobacter mangrovi TaxID=2966350 RepID=A0ABQ5MQA5_9MICC|nr:DUF4192 domain-containing protein [Arthrobacter mangrovi]GLB66170.1 hypothetical protein AHIS1636_06090 [Arthrobacter mangrovi]